MKRHHPRNTEPVPDGRCGGVWAICACSTCSRFPEAFPFGKKGSAESWLAFSLETLIPMPLGKQGILSAHQAAIRWIPPNNCQRTNRLRPHTERFSQLPQCFLLCTHLIQRFIPRPLIKSSPPTPCGAWRCGYPFAFYFWLPFIGWPFLTNGCSRRLHA